MNLIGGILAVFALALLAPGIMRNKGSRGWIFAAAPVAFLALLFPYLRLGDTFLSAPWLPSLDISFSLYLDGLSLLFAVIVSFIGICILLYASAYFAHERDAGRFYMILLLFMGSMLGIVLSANLLLLFIFWELTSVTSYLLIGFKHENEKARSAALQSLLVTGGGGLALMAGILMLYTVTGTFEIREILLQSDAVRAHALYRPMLALFALGAFTKSAQVPFHFWLPGAMTAPTPASAYLHSATMVKAGVYLLARMAPILGGTPEWQWLLQIVGAATMVVAATQALSQTDLKKLLAYTTLSALGMITLLLGIGEPLALKAAMVFLFVHALYKGSLFMIAGGLDHQTGTRDTRMLSGLMRRLPWTAAASFLAALSMMGIPPMIGFIAKELIYEAKLQDAFFPWLLAGIGLYVNAVNVAIAVYAGVRPFLGAPSGAISGVREGATGLWLAPMVTAGAGLILGLFPENLGRMIISPAVSSITAEQVLLQMKLWHGLNLNLVLSVLTILTGVALMLGRKWWWRAEEMALPLKTFTPAACFHKSLYGFLALSEKVTNTLQNGNLGRYLRIVFSVVITALAVRIAMAWDLNSVSFFSGFNLIEPVLVFLMIGGALTAVSAKSRLTAVAALGFVGYGLALIYLIHGAPDVAITQLVIETLTVVLMVLVIYRLPPFQQFSSRALRWRDGATAVLVALVFASLVLLESAGVSAAPISSYFLENSVPLAHGRNVVNVILVDFRALDTLGEITVIAIAALGVYALLKLKIISKD